MSMMHIAIQERLDSNVLEWLEHVTDEECVDSSQLLALEFSGGGDEAAGLDCLFGQPSRCTDERGQKSQKYA